MLNNQPSIQLASIFKRYGHVIISQPKLCKGLLNDLAPQYDLENNLLITALEEGIADELLKPTREPIDILLRRLAQNLHETVGMDEEFADWAVESWALALNIISKPIVKTKTSVKPNPIINTVSTTPEPKKQVAPIFATDVIHQHIKKSAKKTSSKPFQFTLKTPKPIPVLKRVMQQIAQNWSLFIISIIFIIVVLLKIWLLLFYNKQTTHSIQTKPNVSITKIDTTKNISITSKQILPIEPEMVKIKGGCFMMGSPTTEIERFSDEDQHQVCVNDFEIGKYEVTQAQWLSVMGNNPSYFKGDNLPVESISYDKIQEFIERLNYQTNKNYRLPTEAEWEYAARAGTSTTFYTGKCITTKQANYDGDYDYNGCRTKTNVYKQTTVIVGSYPANPWGLYDMTGNVFEWTCSEYNKYYSGSEKVCTNNGKNVLRGGSWYSMPFSLRSAYRSTFNMQHTRHRHSSIGFRLVR